jgi:hypothetical protein
MPVWNLIGAIPLSNYVIASRWWGGRLSGLVSLITLRGLKEIITFVLHVVRSRFWCRTATGDISVCLSLSLSLFFLTFHTLLAGLWTNYLTPRGRVVLQKLTAAQISLPNLLSYSRNFPPFMAPKSSLQCSQKPTTGPYPEEAHESSPHSCNIFKIHCNIFLQSASRSSKWFLPYSFPDQHLHLPRMSHAPPTTYSLIWST